MKKKNWCALLTALMIAAVPVTGLDTQAFNLGNVLGGTKVSKPSLPSSPSSPVGNVATLSPSPYVDNSNYAGGGAYDPSSSTFISGTVQGGANVNILITEGRGNDHSFVKGNVVRVRAFWAGKTDANGNYSIPVKKDYSYTVVAWDGSRLGWGNSRMGKMQPIVLKDVGSQVMFGKP